jgi:hypothetical protein
MVSGRSASGGPRTKGAGRAYASPLNHSTVMESFGAALSEPLRVTVVVLANRLKPRHLARSRLPPVQVFQNSFVFVCFSCRSRHFLHDTRRSPDENGRWTRRQSKQPSLSAWTTTGGKLLRPLNPPIPQTPC